MGKKENFQEQDRIHEEDDVLSDFTCDICDEPTRSIKKFRNGTLCHHPFCLNCIAKYIEGRVEYGGPVIKCPSLDCDNKLDPLSCRSVISKDLFVKWCDRLCDYAVWEIEKRYCPHTTCSTLVLNECNSEVKKTNCPNCKKDFCFKCGIPWHAGYWCSETGQLRDKNDILLGKLLEQRKWIRCYKCGHAIEKDGGCKWLHCRCGSITCHLCGKPDHFLKTCENGWSSEDFRVLFSGMALLVCCFLLVALMVKKFLIKKCS